jgi:hypothetical protein
MGILLHAYVKCATGQQDGANGGSRQRDACVAVCHSHKLQCPLRVGG